MKGKDKNSTTLIAVISVLAVVVLLLGLGAFFALRRRKLKARRQKELQQYREQRDVNNSFWDKRIQEARGQGIELKMLDVGAAAGAGDRPVISGPFDFRRDPIPGEWIKKRDTLDAEKHKEREAGEAMRAYIPTSHAGRDRKFPEAKRAELVADSVAGKFITPGAANTRNHHHEPTVTPKEASVSDSRFAVSDDETMVEHGKEIYRVETPHVTSEAGPSPASMAFPTAILSQDASQPEAGWNGIPYQDAELGRSTSLRDAGPDVDGVDGGGNTGGVSFDHFGGANPYKLKNESAWSDDSRGRKRDRLVQGAKNLGSGLKGKFGRKDSKKAMTVGKKKEGVKY